MPAGEDGKSEREDATQDVSKQSSTTMTDYTSKIPLTNGTEKGSMAEPTEDSGSRFEALVKDRDALRVQVTQLRESLEELQTKHQASLEFVQEELQETQTQKNHAEEQYQTLLGRVNTIKAQLGERLKADAVRPGLGIPDLYEPDIAF
jgi:chromosome segregation ATPase